MSLRPNTAISSHQIWTQRSLDAIQKIPNQRNVALLDRFEINDRSGTDKAVQDAVRSALAGADAETVSRVHSELFSMGPLDALAADSTVTEIVVLSFDRIWVERAGRLEQTDERFLSETTYRNALSRMARVAKTATDFNNPFSDGRWQDFRVHIVAEPVVQSGPQITLRRIRKNSWTLEELAAIDWCESSAVTTLRDLVRKGSNVLVVGGTGTGKTSALAACLKEINTNERCIILEDTDELPLPNDVSTKLLTKRSRVPTDTGYDLGELLKQSLRMRPDRLIMGEVRGAEAKDLLMSFATGHRGCWGTLHAENAREALLRLEMLVQFGAPQWSSHTVRQLIHTAIDAVICIGRDENGTRRLESISRIASLEPMGFCFSSHYARKSMKLPRG